MVVLACTYSNKDSPTFLKAVLRELSRPFWTPGRHFNNSKPKFHVLSSGREETHIFHSFLFCESLIRSKFSHTQHFSSNSPHPIPQFPFSFSPHLFQFEMSFLVKLLAML